MLQDRHALTALQQDTCGTKKFPYNCTSFENLESAMLERRQQTRFHPGSSLSASLNVDSTASPTNALPADAEPGSLQGRVEDVSSRGFKMQLPQHLCRHLSIGQEVSGHLHGAGDAHAWHGNITHLQPRSGGMSIGIALQTSHGSSPLKDTVDQVARDPKTGAISLRRQEKQVFLDVIGHLSLALSRDFLHLVRSGSLTGINLTQCKGMDSAGLGMLCIAVDAHIPLLNATGIVKELLEVARIPSQPEPENPRTARSGNPAHVNPVRPAAPRTVPGRA